MKILKKKKTHHTPPSPSTTSVLSDMYVGMYVLLRTKYFVCIRMHVRPPYFVRRFLRSTSTSRHVHGTLKHGQSRCPTTRDRPARGQRVCPRAPENEIRNLPSRRAEGDLGSISQDSRKKMPAGWVPESYSCCRHIHSRIKPWKSQVVRHSGLL